MVGLGFRAISSGQLSPGIAEPLQYSCKSRNEIREKNQDLHRWEPGWVREQLSVVSCQFTVRILCHSDDARSAEEESAVCSRRETSRFLVALLLGMTRLWGLGKSKGKTKRARHIFRARASRRFKTWLS